MSELKVEDLEPPEIDAYWHVNDAGVQEIRDFIRMHHKKGSEMHKDDETIQFYAMLVELNMMAGNGQYFDIPAIEEVTGTNIECWLMDESIGARLLS